MTYLNEFTRIQFPDPRNAPAMGLVAVGGNLSPGVILSAYEQGIFPWYDEDPIAWFSPDPRYVLRPPDLHIPRRLERFIRNADFDISFDRDFPAVIRNCREISRKGQDGTWITREMEMAYIELHGLGYAHSVEVWKNGLVGGLYGISIGRIFAGESMFSLISGASKAAFIALTRFLEGRNVPLIDCQVRTPLLESFGAVDMERNAFLSELAGLVGGVNSLSDWSGIRATELLKEVLSQG